MTIPAGVLNEENIPLEIKTGDGETYKPSKEQGGGGSIRPNASGYDKPNTEGSDVRRNSSSTPVL